MQTELIVSIAIRFLAAGWAGWVAWRERDWRIVVFVVLFLLMAVQQRFRLLGIASELPGLGATFTAVAAMVLMGRVLKERTQTTEELRARHALNASLVANLKATNAELEHVYRTAPVGLALVDRDLRFMRINDRLAAMNGIPVAEHIGRTFDETLPELAPTLNTLYRSVIDTGQPVENIAIHGTTPAEPTVERDWVASYHPFTDAGGSVAGVSAVVLEVTEQKKAEDALRQSERELRESEIHFRELFEQASDGIFITDPRGRFLNANLAGCELVGYSRIELLGLSIPDLVHGDEVPRVAPEIDRLDSKAIVRSEWRCRRKDGSIFVCEATAKQLSDGRLQAFVRDITERNRVEQALRESEERFRLVFEKVAYAAVLSHLPSRTVVQVNEAFERIFGYSRQEAIGKPVLEQGIVPAEVRDEVLAELQAHGQLRDRELHVRSKSGEGHVVLLNSDFIEIGGEKYVLSIATDITDRRRAEAALRESQTRLQLALQATELGPWDWDMITNRVYFSPEWKRQLGYDDHEVDDRYEEWESRLHPDDRAATLDALRAYLAGEWPEYDVEFRLRHKDGSYRWFYTRGEVQRDAEGKPVRMFGCHLDITDRKRAEQELRESQVSLEVAQEQAQLGSWEYFPWLNRGTWSKQMYRLFNRDPALGPPSMDEFLQLLHPEDRLLIAQSLTQATGEGTPGELVFRNNSELGPPRYFHVHAEATSDKQGRLYFAGTLQDITARKRSEDALRSRERELHDANVKLQALSRQLLESQETERRQIARELHDEIGQILAAVSLRLQNLQLTCNASLRAHVAEDIAVVDQAIQQVRDLSLDLRPPTLDLLGLESTLRSLAEDHLRRTGVDVRFVGHLDVRLPQHLEIAGYRVVQAALTNVVRHAKARQASIELRQVDHDVELIVRDDGIGFDVAAATRRALRGDSFGLLGMQERIELVGGSFTVESEPGSGTTVRVSFPIPDDVD